MDLFPKEAIARNTSPGPDLAAKWRNWIADPVNRASLINTGLALLQPVSPGQSVIGHIGQGVAAGMGLRGRYEEQQRKVKDAETKRDIEQQKLLLDQAQLEEQKKNNASDANYRKGMLGVQQEQNAIARDRLKQGNMTLSQMLTQNRFETSQATSAAARKAKWLQDEIFFAGGQENVTPEWLVQKEREWNTIQQFAGGQAAGSAATNPPTEADFINTAEKHGVSVEEVKRRWYEKNAP